ncbi:hypothetical protein OQA88_3311 [Cercophora sp. LCS_1]
MSLTSLSTHFAKTVSCSVQPVNDGNPLGQIKRAELVIRGQVAFDEGGKIMARMKPRKERQWNVFGLKGSWVIDREETMYGLYPADLQRFYARSKPRESTWPQKSSLKGENSGPAWCLVLGKASITSTGQAGEVDRLVGLVIMKAGVDSYQRVGFAIFDNFVRNDPSTEATVQIIWIALAPITSSGRHKPAFVLSAIKRSLTDHRTAVPIRLQQHFIRFRAHGYLVSSGIGISPDQ